MPAGRPTVYTPEISEEICSRLSGGESLRSIVNSEDMPDKSTVMRWLFREGEEFEIFRDHYAQARQMQAELMADEILDIADDSTNDYMTRQDKDGEDYEVANNENIQRSKLRVDSRKWVASRLLPKKYGDRVTQQHVGPDDGPISFLQAIQPSVGPPKIRDEDDNGSG